MTSPQRYNWQNDIPILENHSRCKHEIIRDYLIQYMCVVAKGFLPYADKTFNLTIVDGFAGGGKYAYENKEVDGSPLVILKAAQEAKTLIAIERAELGRDPLNMNIDFFFVEKEKNAAEFLRNTLKSEGHFNERTHVLHGEFGDYLPNIIKTIKGKSGGMKGKAIFVLDQYGFSQVLLGQLRKIMVSLRSEVILTFAVDPLVAYLGGEKKPTLQKIGFTDADITQIYQRNNPDECRGMIQYVLTKHICDMGFSFTPFCIYGDTSHWGYWLVHLSSHYRARDEMMNIHWNKGNQMVHYGGEGLDMFGYRSKQDEKHTKQSMLVDAFRFDHYAKEKVLTALRNEIPKLIHQKNQIRYSDLLNETFNHTPANREIIKRVLREGVGNKEFSIPRREVKNIKDDDIITASPQKSIFITRH